MAARINDHSPETLVHESLKKIHDKLEVILPYLDKLHDKIDALAKAPEADEREEPSEPPKNE